MLIYNELNKTNNMDYYISCEAKTRVLSFARNLPTELNQSSLIRYSIRKLIG